MADVKGLIETVLRLAKEAAPLIPVLGQGAVLGEKVVDLIDTLTDDAPDSRTQQEMQVERQKLRAAVSAKANATADRLEGR